MKDMHKYLRPTVAIDSDNELIIEKAKSVTIGQNNELDRAISLFYFVRDEIKYNAWVFTDRPEHYVASRTLARGNGFCIQKAVLLAALSRVAGIPARLRMAGIRNHLMPDDMRNMARSDCLPDHCYNELYVEGKWIKVATPFDLETCRKYHFIPVDFDGRHDAMLHPYNQEGKRHIEYVEDRGHFDDLPFDLIVELRNKATGPDWPQHLKQILASRGIME